MQPSVQNALQEARRRLEELYGDRLVHVILYGSQARGDARPDSDVDVLVVLRDAFNRYTEIKRVSDLKFDLLFTYGTYFSFRIYEQNTYEEASRPFILNVREEGIPL